MEYKKEAVSSDFIIHHASSTTSKRFFSSLRTAFQMKCVTMYMAAGFKSSSMSRTENTTNFLLMSTLVGWLMKLDHEPCVYFVRRCRMESVPSIPDNTISKSDKSGASMVEKSESAVISFNEYVSVMARSMTESSSGVSPPSMMRNNPTRLMMLLRKTSAAASSSRGIG